jgi:membrane protein implicated in regulation of membrane protease activity
MIAAAFLILLGCYLACGLVVAIPFAFVGVGRIDPHAAHGSWGFRLLIIPGSTAFWPLLLRRWLRGVKEPPEEGNDHRLAARRSRREEAVGEISQNSQSLLTSAATRSKV